MTIPKLTATLGLIGSIVVGTMFIQDKVVLAADYYEDRLSTILRFINSDIRTIENSIVIARENDNARRVEELERERQYLEEERREIRKRQLNEQ